MTPMLVSGWLIWPGVFLSFIVGFFFFVQIGSNRAVMAWVALFLILSAMTFYLLIGFHAWIPPLAFYAAITAVLVIAHDFNNILSAIMGYTQLAALSIPEDNKAKDKLEEVLKACRRAANLVMQILSFSRQSKQEKVPLMLRPIIKEVLKLLRATLPSNIELKENIQGKEKVYGDPNQIYQVVLNLCTNSSQAMAGRPGQIEVTLESVDIDSYADSASLELQKGRYVKISVADTGNGIPDDIKKRIFDPYFTTKGKETGTGLGLATNHGIIKNHGGCIRFESLENKGTTFNVYLSMVEMPDKKS